MLEYLIGINVVLVIGIFTGAYMSSDSFREALGVTFAAAIGCTLGLLIVYIILLHF